MAENEESNRGLVPANHYQISSCNVRFGDEHIYRDIILKVPNLFELPLAFQHSGEETREFLQNLLSGRSGDEASTPDDEDAVSYSWSDELTLVLQMEPRISTLMTKGKYHEAYGLMQALEKCGPELRDTSFLLKYYSSLVRTNRPNHAKLVFEKLADTLKKNNITGPHNIIKSAKKLKSEEKHMEAVCLYRLAAASFSDSIEANLILLQCVQGITQSLDKLIEIDVSLRLTIKQNIVPHTLDIFKRARSMKRIKNKHGMLMESVAFHCLECCQFYAKDHEARIDTVLEAIAFMEESFGPNVTKYQLYGTFLHNLGATYLMLTQLRPAEGFLHKAIDAFCHATDSTPKQLQDHIASGQAKLELITMCKI